MKTASEWLVELDAHTGAETVTRYFSGSGYVSKPDDDPANTVYDGRIAGLSAFGVHLFGDGRTMGDASIDMADMTLSNADGALDDMRRFAVDGRPFVLRRLAARRAALSSSDVVMTGTMEGIDADNGALSLLVRFYDRRRDIDVPLQTETYAGTTIAAAPTAEGSADLKDRLKPLVFGKAFNVPATVVNEFNLFLQFSASAVSSIVLYDGGVPLINDGDVADLAALYAATGNPGHYRTCLAQGLAKPFGAFNGRPAYTWTADVTEGATAADRRAGAIVSRMISRVSGGAIDAASFAALDALQTAELGIYIDGETTALNAAYDVLRSIGAFLVPNRLGAFTVGRLDAPGVPVATITEPEILTASKDETIAIVSNPDTDGGLPAHKITLKYRRNWHVHGDSDLGACVNYADATRAGILKKEWREAVAEDAAVKTRHPLSRDLQIETCIVSEAAATAEVARRLTLYGVDRDVLRVAVDWRDADAMSVNQTVTLRMSRHGYADGRAMRIIGRIDDHAAEKSILILWG
jgi:hypothetical protein